MSARAWASACDEVRAGRPCGRKDVDGAPAQALVAKPAKAEDNKTRRDMRFIMASFRQSLARGTIHHKMNFTYCEPRRTRLLRPGHVDSPVQSPCDLISVEDSDDIGTFRKHQQGGALAASRAARRAGKRAVR